ncbi:MAG: AMP-binding protein, partial [Methanobrevibacter sp.]
SLLMLSEEEYWALAIARAYKKTYGKDIIFNRETYGRDESIAKLNRTIGWFTSQYPILVNIDNDYDDVSLMNDVYNIKTAFKDVNNLGLNYYSLIYTTKEFDFKPCPVTFNFLSSEFSFKNELFESYIPELSYDYEAIKQDFESYGITFNIVRNGNFYEISGDYAGGTFIGDEFNEFIENIKSELKFLGDYQFKDNNIVCCLSEAQLGIYLDEKVFEKDVAYSTTGIFEYGHDNSIDEINGAIHALINKHPILKGRVLDTANVPLLVCDSYPPIEIVNNGDYSDLIKPFDLDKSLARFYIMDNEENKFVFYDIHHMISDATSHKIIKNELNQALMGKLDDAVDLGFVYASMDSFESQYGDKYKSAQEFFQNTFADIGDVQYLLGDVDGKIGSVSLPIRGIHENAELFAQNNGITVGSLLNAVFAYTYSRFTGSDKVYYNFTEHGRHEDYLQDAVGMFVRTIPVIVDCENKSVKDYVANVADLILKSMANSIYPFRLTAREFDLSNDVAFEYNYDLNEFEVGDEIVVRDDADKVSDFLCVVNDLEDGFLVTVSHLDKFSRHTATQFVKVFKEVLTQFLEKENLGDIDYISNEDVELLNSYNKTEHSLVYNDVLDAFNDNLLEHPENKLVSYKDVSYTYAEGAYIADAIGKKLLDLGVGSQDCVSFLVPRSELYMFSILGIMSIGGIYVPLDDALPDERIGFMIRDTNSSMIIVTDETYNRAKELSDGIAILNISDILKGDIGSLSSLPVVYDNIASILYTSGTTGIPKGVKITRKALLNVATYYTETFYLDNEDVYGLYASIGFDAGVMSIFKAIYSGACLSVVPEEIRYNMYKLNDYFIEHNVTHTIITTPVGKLFMQTIDDTSLDYLFVGGEKLGEFQSPQNYQLVDEYGPTEGNNFISSINNSDKIDYSSVGKLNYNSKAYILDNEGRRVSCGAVGELYLAGYQIADGYLNREEETNNAFISNSFDRDENYATLYRTGDLVRLLPDGSLGIVGRRDGQVKVRGNRVELSEVESTIRELDYISDVTVQTIKNDDNNELVAYVVASHETEDIKESVCNHVNKYKPDYMVPSFVIQIDSIPLTVNGKVNKRELPDVDLSSLREEYVAPTNDIEKAIVEAFEKVFNDKIGIYDDFLRLGGDSLIGIKLLSYLEGYNINLVDVLSLRTPHAIAEKVAGYEQQFDLDIYSLESGCPLNESQLNIYLDILANDKVDAYLIASYTAISKEYEVDDIIDALNELLNIHPILGMCVNDEFEMPYLVKGSPPEIIVDPNVDRNVHEITAK